MDKELVERFYTIAEGMRKNAITHHKLSFMSHSEFMMLQVIVFCITEFGEATTSELSDYLHISKPAVSQMISVLEEKQLVTRQISSADRRKTSIALTEKGQARVTEEKEKLISKLGNVFDKMGREDSEMFITLAEKYFSILKTCKQNTEK